MRRAQTPSLIQFVLPRGWALIAATFWLAINLLCLKQFPTVFIDEAENANHAYNAAFHGQAVFSLYDDLYPSRLEFLRQSWPPVIRPFFVRPLASFIKRVGFSLFRARLFSLILGFLCLLLVYEAGAALSGPVLGMGAMALLGTYFPFLYSSHSIRPEISLACDGLCLFLALVFALENNYPMWYLVSGFLTGIAPGFHTNGVAFLVPVSLVLFLNCRWRGMFWVLTGWTLGTLLFIRLADWQRFVPGYYALFFREFTTPPLFLNRGNLLKMLVDESTRYFGDWIFGQWTGGLFFNRLLSVQQVVLGGAVLWGCCGSQKRPEKLAALFAAALAVTYTLLVGQKASNYLTVPAPFFALSGAAWLLHNWPLPRSSDELKEWPKAIQAGAAWAGWIVFSAAAAGAIFLVAVVAFSRPSFEAVSNRLSAQIPASSRVAGPQTLWLGMPSDQYRDVGVLVWYRMLLNEKNLWRPLEGWKPQYLILDYSLASRLARLSREPHQPRMYGPTNFLPWPHEVLDYFPTAPAYGDSVMLLRIDWPRQVSK